MVKITDTRSQIARSLGPLMLAFLAFAELILWAAGLQTVMETIATLLFIAIMLLVIIAVGVND